MIWMLNLGEGQRQGIRPGIFFKEDKAAGCYRPDRYTCLFFARPE